MRATQAVNRTVKSVLARAWRPRAEAGAEAAIATGARHPERFTTQIVLSDGSSFRVRSTAPRAQVKITKDTRSHPLWNPQADRRVDDEGGYLSSFQKKFAAIADLDFAFADDQQQQQQQQSKPPRPAAAAGSGKKKSGK